MLCAEIDGLAVCGYTKIFYQLKSICRTILILIWHKMNIYRQSDYWNPDLWGKDNVWIEIKFKSPVVITDKSISVNLSCAEKISLYNSLDNI